MGCRQAGCIYSFLYFFTIFVQICFSESDLQNLKLLSIIFRHGDRTPISYYPNDPNINVTWPEGLGQLTNLGKIQHYTLGRYLRKRYAEFITTTPREVYARSSAKDRALSSAQCNLASLYSPNKNWTWNKDLKWQPIPIYTVPLNEDEILFSDSICPEATMEQIRILHSIAGQEFLKKYEKVFEYLSYHSGTTISNWTSAAYLHDTLKIEKEHNLTVPDWAEPMWGNLSYLSDMSFYWAFSTKLIHRLRGGPLLKMILENMKAATVNKTQKSVKVYLYSTHDTVVAAVMNALEVFNYKAPPYCATILVELHEISSKNSSYGVRILYLNSTKPQDQIEKPHILILPDCEELCPLEKFSDIIENCLPTNWKSECGLNQSYFSIPAIIAISILVVLIVMVSSAFAYIVWKYTVSRRGHALYLPVPTN